MSPRGSHSRSQDARETSRRLEGLLLTKLTPASKNMAIMRRGRLLARLSANQTEKLRIILGVPGSGKSILLHDYTSSQGIPVAWYALDETDLDAGVFLSYLIKSLDIHYPSVTSRIVPRLGDMTPALQSWKDILTLLINEMHAYGEDIILVLDNYHALHDAYPIPDIVEFLLLNSPRNFRCFIGSRTIPRLPLASLRARNELVLIGPEEMLLDKNEVRQFFEEIYRQPISEAALELIQLRTEGWFAAVRLIAQSTRDRSGSEVEHYLQSINLTEPLIYDYVANALFLRQSERALFFLKCTSILKSFNLDLAQHVTGFQDAQTILDEVERMNLFVVHLDATHEWFRYQDLFGDSLRSLLYKELGRSEVLELHRRAGCWYEEHGHTVEAIDHYFQAEQFEDVARLLERDGLTLFQRGLLLSLTGRFALIPEKLLEGSPDLLLLWGEVYDRGGVWEKAVGCYERAEVLLKEMNATERIPSVLEKRIRCFIKYGAYSKVIDGCHRALKMCPPHDTGLRSRLLTWLGVADVASGGERWEKGYQLLKEGYALAYEAGQPEAIAAACTGYGFGYHFPQGNFLEAERVFNEGTDFLKRLGFPCLGVSQMMNKAVVQIVAGALEKAARTLEEALPVAEEYQIHFVNQALNIAGLMLSLEKRDLLKAGGFISETIRLEIPVQLRPWYYRSVALFHLRSGSLEQAVVAGREMLQQLTVVGKGFYASECYLVLGVIYWKKRLYYKAKRWFDEALAIARQGKMKFWAMKAHYCLAALFARVGKISPEFTEHYRAAVRLSRENNYWHVWTIDSHELTVPILTEAFRLRVDPEETLEVMERVKPGIIESAEKILKSGTSTQRALACELLGVLKDPRAAFLLKEARGDSSSVVRDKAAKAFSCSRPPPQPLVITTLGRFSVQRNLLEIHSRDWQRGKALALFKYFLTCYPKEVILDQLLETFWPKLSLEDARHNLSVYLNYVRRVLNPSGTRGDDSRICRHMDRYRLVLGEDDQLDVTTFRLLCQEGNDLWRHHELQAAAQRFKEAVKLYRGEFLESDPYEEWAHQRREDLRKQYLLVLEKLGALHEERKEFQEALTYYHLFLERSPAQEKIARSVLRCLAVLGDRVTAKREYSRFRLYLKGQRTHGDAAVEIPTRQVAPSA